MKRRKTGFELFAQKFLIISIFIFVFGMTAVKSIESTYNREIQELPNEIATMNSEIDSLEMQKQELVSFNRISSVAAQKGYTYQNDATAAVDQN